MKINLIQGERLIASRGQSFFSLMPRQALALCAAAIGCALYTPEQTHIFGVITLFFALGTSAWAELDRYFSGLWLTNRKLTVRLGLFHRPIDIPLNRLNYGLVEQNSWSRRFNVGLICGQGLLGAPTPLLCITRPWAFHKIMKQALHRKNRQGAGRRPPKQVN